MAYYEEKTTYEKVGESIKSAIRNYIIYPISKLSPNILDDSIFSKTIRKLEKILE